MLAQHKTDVRYQGTEDRFGRSQVIEEWKIGHMDDWIDGKKINFRFVHLSILPIVRFVIKINSIRFCPGAGSISGEYDIIW